MPSAPETVVDLSRLELSPGEGKRIELPVELAPFELGGQTYRARPERSRPTKIASRTVTRQPSGFAFKLELPPATSRGPACAASSRWTSTSSARGRRPRRGCRLRGPYNATTS